MYLSELYLQNFRNYTEATLEFTPGINKILGSNAQGKTNLLEAIYLLATGQSFRTTNLRDLIKEGANHFYIEAHFIKNDTKQKLRLYFDGQVRRIAHNSTSYSSFSKLVGLIPGVVWSPEDQSLIKSSPAVRRRFLDYQIAQFDPLYVRHLTRYNKAMRQRNCLLKEGKLDTLDSWEQTMADAAVYVVQQRRDTINKLLPQTQQIQQSLSADGINFEYQTTVPQKDLLEYYLAEYQRLRPNEVVRGYTLTGPHRDDLTIQIQNKDAHHFASEGQQRCAVASIRLAQWYNLQQEIDHKPLMIIDDIGVSLDEQRSKHLGDQVKHLGQVFLSAPQALPWDEIEDSKTMVIKEGRVYT